MIISGLIARFDYLVRVNYLLKDICQEEGITLIDNSNINPAKHLNSSKLHLNRAGDDIFADNLFRALEIDFLYKIPKIFQNLIRKVPSMKLLMLPIPQWKAMMLPHN